MTTNPASRRKRLFSEAALVGLGKFGVLVLGLLGIRLLTQALSKSDFGVFTLALTVVGFAQQFVYGPLSSGSMRFATVIDPAERAIAVTYAVAIRRTKLLLGAAITLAGVLALVGRINAVLPMAAALLYAIFVGLSAILRSEFRAKRRRGTIAALDNFSATMRWIPAAIGAAVGGSARYAVVGLLAGGLIDYAVQRRVSRGRLDPKLTADSDNDAKRITDFALPFTVLGIAIWARLATERWALNGFESTEEVAAYAVLVLTIARPIEIISTAINQLFSPIFFQRAGATEVRENVDRANRLNVRLVYAVLGVGLAGTTMAFLAGPWFVELIAGSDFIVTRWMTAAVALTGVMWATGHLSSLVFMSNLQPKSLYAPQVSAQVVGIAGAVAGAATFGVNGVILAGALAAAVFAALSLLAARRTVDPAPSTPTSSTQL